MTGEWEKALQAVAVYTGYIWLSDDEAIADAGKALATLQRIHQQDVEDEARAIGFADDFKTKLEEAEAEIARLKAAGGHAPSAEELALAIQRTWYPQDDDEGWSPRAIFTAKWLLRTYDIKLANRCATAKEEKE